MKPVKGKDRKGRNTQGGRESLINKVAFVQESECHEGASHENVFKEHSRLGK